MEYIEIDTSLVPYRFGLTLADEDFVLDVRYNELFDYYTIDLYKDDVLVVAGEKLVYGMSLFATANQFELLPAPTIIPLDPSGRITRVGRDTLGKQVFLILQNDGGEADD